MLTQVTESAQQLEVPLMFAKHNGRVPREGGSASARSDTPAGGRIFVEIVLGAFCGRSWRSLCVVLAPLGPFSALVGRFSAAGGAQEASEEGFWSKND